MPEGESFVVRQMANLLNASEYSRLTIPDIISPDQLDTLRVIYGSRLAYHSDQISRMWTRYAFIVTLEIALASFALSSNLLGVYIIGVVVSLLGYVFLAQERYFFLCLRTECAHIEHCLLSGAGITFIPGFGSFSTPNLVGQSIIRQSFWAWTRESVITSRLIVYSAFSFLLTWLAALIWRLV